MSRFLSKLNQRRHRLMHLLRFNLSRSVLVGCGMPNLYEVCSECLTCKERKSTGILAVPGHGNITYFSRGGKDLGSTYDTVETETGFSHKIGGRAY
jgi:hypothetical protein